jgi:integrase
MFSRLFSMFKKKKQSPKSLITLRQAFVKYQAKELLTKKGINSEESIIKSWIKTRIADKPVDKIFPKDLAKVRDLWMTKLKPATVNRRLAVLSTLYSIMIRDWGYERLTNPVNKIRKPIVRNARTRRLLLGVNARGLPKEEITWLLEQTRSAEMPLVIELAIETAMRRSELIGTLWKNVDLKRGTITIPDTKNGETRVVPLSPRAKELLSSKTRSGDYIFDMTESSVTKSFNRLVERCRKKYLLNCQKYKLEISDKFFVDLRFHDLRHEAISRLSPHFQVHELAKISGHKDTRMLMRYYHPNAEEMSKRLEKISKKKVG